MVVYDIVLMALYMAFNGGQPEHLTENQGILNGNLYGSKWRIN